jgi:hypothetical protein
MSLPWSASAMFPRSLYKSYHLTTLVLRLMATIWLPAIRQGPRSRRHCLTHSRQVLCARLWCPNHFGKCEC